MCFITCECEGVDLNNCRETYFFLFSFPLLFFLLSTCRSLSLDHRFSLLNSSFVVLLRASIKILWERDIDERPPAVYKTAHNPSNCTNYYYATSIPKLGRDNLICKSSIK